MSNSAQENRPGDANQGGSGAPLTPVVLDEKIRELRKQEITNRIRQLISKTGANQATIAEKQKDLQGIWSKWDRVDIAVDAGVGGLGLILAIATATGPLGLAGLVLAIYGFGKPLGVAWHKKRRVQKLIREIESAHKQIVDDAEEIQRLQAELGRLS